MATANLSALGLSLSQVEAELRAKRANHDWLVDHKQALREDYPDRYVAVLNGKVVADERDIDLSQTSYLDEKGKKVEIDCSWPALESKSGL